MAVGLGADQIGSLEEEMPLSHRYWQDYCLLLFGIQRMGETTYSGDKGNRPPRPLPRLCDRVARPAEDTFHEIPDGRDEKDKENRARSS